MIHAYAEMYLNDAMNNLGEAFDYAFNVCKVSLDDFVKLFIVSGYAECFAAGNPKIISGMSGTELAMNVFSASGKMCNFAIPQLEYDFSAEYWCGWILAFYQWKTNRSFKNICTYISMKEVASLYPVLHEAPEDKFVDAMNSVIVRKTKSTKLQEQRKSMGLTQAELAKKADVNLRTLQQYETGAKNINKASVQSVITLANILKCKIEDILE